MASVVVPVVASGRVVIITTLVVLLSVISIEAFTPQSFAVWRSKVSWRSLVSKREMAGGQCGAMHAHGWMMRSFFFRRFWFLKTMTFVTLLHTSSNFFCMYTAYITFYFEFCTS